MANLGPADYSPYAVAMEDELYTPPEGKAMLLTEMVDEEVALREVARVMLTSDNATIFPGPQVLYAWSDEAKKKATLIKEMAEVLGAKMIPMYDYRPKYPKIDAEVEINPNHPNFSNSNYYHFILNKGSKIICIAELKWIKNSNPTIKYLTIDKPHETQRVCHRI